MELSGQLLSFFPLIPTSLDGKKTHCWLTASSSSSSKKRKKKKSQSAELACCFAGLSMRGFSYQLNISVPTEALFLRTKKKEAMSQVCIIYWCNSNAETLWNVATFCLTYLFRDLTKQTEGFALRHLSGHWFWQFSFESVPCLIVLLLRLTCISIGLHPSIQKMGNKCTEKPTESPRCWATRRCQNSFRNPWHPFHIAEVLITSDLFSGMNSPGVVPKLTAVSTFEKTSQSQLFLKRKTM